MTNRYRIGIFSNNVLQKAFIRNRSADESHLAPPAIFPIRASTSRGIEISGGRRIYGHERSKLRTLEAEERVASEQVVSSRSDLWAILAREREARINLERIQKLVEAGVAPAAQLDSARATLETLHAQKQAAESTIARLQKSVEASWALLAQAEAQSLRVRDALSKTRITASMDGIVAASINGTQ